MQTPNTNHTQKCLTKKTYKGFTLVELIVVITILVILGTIAFINLGGFAGSARDSSRISNLTSLKKGLDIFQIKSGAYPMPESSATLMMSGGTIAYQGFAKDQIGSIAKISPGGVLDPSDKTLYTTFTITTDKKKMQLMAFLEDRSTIISFLAPSSVYASATTDYSKRFSYVTGDKIGILLSSGTLAPFQESTTGSIDLGTTATGYTVYFDNKTTSSGTGGVLQTAFVASSVVYNSGPSCNSTQPACSSTGCTLLAGTPTSVSQSWVKDAVNCGFSCKANYSGLNCETYTAPLPGFTFNSINYMVTPGHCTDSATPTCDGGTDTLTKAWGSFSITTSATGTNDGAGNTTKILALDPTAPAAKYCSDMSYAGYTDWFLPAINELSAMFNNRSSIGGFTINDGSSTYYYWSSTEYSGDSRTALDFFSNFGVGSQTGPYKSDIISVRCIRKS